MSPFKINFPNFVRRSVMPVLNPTVPIAEADSNRIPSNGSVTESATR
jgi:hypothetical protein